VIFCDSSFYQSFILEGCMGLNFYHAAVSTTTPVFKAAGIVDGNAAHIGARHAFSPGWQHIAPV